MKIRSPAVAGRFYPADARGLEAEVRGHLAAAAPPRGGRPKGLIAPHAGYVYSGPVAGSAFRQLEPWRDSIERVILLGPSHFVPFEGLALPSVQAFATPLGEVGVAGDAATRLAGLPQTFVSDVAHGREHALEVELPFLQVALDRFELVPLVVGDASPEEVAEVLDRLWGGDETLIVVSTDLSHYRDYATAAGYVLSVLKRLPQEGEHFTDQDWRFEVVDMDGRKIDKLLVSPVVPKAASGAS